MEHFENLVLADLDDDDLFETFCYLLECRGHNDLSIKLKEIWNHETTDRRGHCGVPMLGELRTDESETGTGASRVGSAESGRIDVPDAS